MALLWSPESWSQRLAELEARSGELKEAPLRRDVRSLGTLLGEVLREQAGEDLFAHVEALRQGNDPAAGCRGSRERRRGEAAWRQSAGTGALAAGGAGNSAEPGIRFLFRADQSGGDKSPQAAAYCAATDGRGGKTARVAGWNIVRDAAGGDHSRGGDGMAQANPDSARVYGAPDGGGAAHGDDQAPADRGFSGAARPDPGGRAGAGAA